MGMEGLSSKTGDGLLGGFWQAAGLGAKSGPVNLVANYRMADRSHMDADLVSPAGFQAAFDHGGDRFALDVIITLQHLPVGDRLAAAGADRILSRAWGWRSIGLSTVPLGSRGTPQTKAIYRRCNGPVLPWSANCAVKA